MNTIIYKSCLWFGCIAMVCLICYVIGHIEGYAAGYAARDAMPRPLPSRHEVRQWQIYMTERGTYDGPIDAKIGPKMKAAIEVFWMTYPYMQGEKDRGEQNE